MDTPPVPKKPLNRRASMRKPGRKSIRFVCRRGATGLGASLASGFLDVSESGVQVVSKDLLQLGEEVEVVLEGYGMRTAIKRLGEVRWCVAIDGGGCRAGIKFGKPIPFRELQNVAVP